MVQLLTGKCGCGASAANRVALSSLFPHARLDQRAARAREPRDNRHFLKPWARTTRRGGRECD